MFSQLQRSPERTKEPTNPLPPHTHPPVTGSPQSLPRLELKEKCSFSQPPPVGNSGQEALLWLGVQTPGASKRPKPGGPGS